MKILNFLHYFIVNLMGYNVLPCFIKYNGHEWHNVAFRNITDKRWHVFYSRFNGKGHDGHATEEMIDVCSRFKYIAFLKTLCVLFRMRKSITFSIDNY